MDEIERNAIADFTEICFQNEKAYERAGKPVNLRHCVQQADDEIMARYGFRIKELFKR
jgi:hypothetical protein